MALRKKRAAALGSSSGGRMWSVVGPIGFLLLWSVVSTLELVNPLLLPSPSRVFLSVRDIGFVLVWHIIATLSRVLAGFFCGAILGVIIGTSMQYNRRLYLLLDGIVETFRPVPPVALVPFFILLFGFSETGKIIITTLGTLLVITVGTVEAIERVPSGILRWGLVACSTRLSLFWKVILPAAWPEMRGTFRIAMALAITLVIVSEFMGAKYGLGYLISVSKITLTTPSLLLSAILLGWLGWGLDRILRYLFDKTCAWDVRAKGATK